MCSCTGHSFKFSLSLHTGTCTKCQQPKKNLYYLCYHLRQRMNRQPTFKPKASNLYSLHTNYGVISCRLFTTDDGGRASNSSSLMQTMTDYNKSQLMSFSDCFSTQLNTYQTVQHSLNSLTIHFLLLQPYAIKVLDTC